MSYQPKHPLHLNADSRSGSSQLPDMMRSHAHPEPSSAASAASLGNLRNRYAGDGPEEGVTSEYYSGKTASEASSKTAQRTRRSERFDLQRHAAALTPDMRVARCLWTASGSFVELLKRAEGARFTGLQTCGSVWMCPCCSARISEVRRQELRVLEEWAGSPKRGLRLIMMTLTARHRNRRLADMVDRMGRAKARMQNRKPWKNLRLDRTLFGSVSVREATHGGDNGWHPHYHVLCLVRADSDEEAIQLLEPVRRVWVECLRKEGLSGTLERAFDLQSGDAVSAYISKHGRNQEDVKDAAAARPAWGMAEEMTLSRTKKGRKGGRSPWQILRDAAAGDEASATLWQEYARVMHGKRQQVWSNNLKAECGLLDVEDEEIAEGEEFTEEQDDRIGQWPRPIWNRIRHKRAELLDAAETGGPDAVAVLVDRILIGDPEDDDDALVEEWSDGSVNNNPGRSCGDPFTLSPGSQVYVPKPDGLAARALGRIQPPLQ